MQQLAHLLINLLFIGTDVVRVCFFFQFWSRNLSHVHIALRVLHRNRHTVRNNKNKVENAKERIGILIVHDYMVQ